MEFQTVVADNYKTARESWGEESLNTIRYIEFMASTMRKDISKWDFTDFMTTNNKPYVDKSKINKIFTDKAMATDRNSASASLTCKPFTFDQDVTNKLLELTKTRGNNDLASWKSQIATIQTNMDSYLNNIRTQATNLRDFQRKINSHVAVGNTELVSQVEKVCSEGFWSFLGISGNNVELRTVNELVLTYHNKTAGINISVNLGRFKLQINFDSLIPTIHSFSNNINLGYFHPHVSRSVICWGELGNSLQAMVNRGEIGNILRLTQTLITSYNPASTFMDIERFYISRYMITEGLSGPTVSHDSVNAIFNTLDRFNNKATKKLTIDQVLPFAKRLITGANLAMENNKIKCVGGHHYPPVNKNNLSFYETANLDDGNELPIYVKFHDAESYADANFDDDDEFELDTEDSNYHHYYELVDGTRCNSIGRPIKV